MLAPFVFRTGARLLQSQLSYHFNRLVGVTPGRFRMSARIA
jgi:hypothetical protein